MGCRPSIGDTLFLTPGRYELICKIAGHYVAGMSAELDVTGVPK